MLASLSPLLLGASLYAGGLTDSIMPDPDLRYGLFAGMGTGISMSGQAKDRRSTRSPMFLSLGASATLSNLPWLTFDAAMLFEFERRVGFGLAPRIRANVHSGTRFKLSAGVGVPVFVAPYTLLGVAAFGRAQVKVLPKLTLYAEPTVTTFIAGTDLVKGQGLMKMDMVLGMNFPF